jgi:hypothetical protein
MTMGILRDNTRLKASLDNAAEEYQAFKFHLAAEQRAIGIPERAAQARERIASASGRKALDEAFRHAARALSR